MSTHTSDVVIAGGGIAGLTLALTLAKAGRRALVLEGRDAFSEAGAGIQLGPNATRILRSLGLLDDLAAYAVSPDEIIVSDAKSGRQIARLPLGRWIEDRHGAPYLVVRRTDLQSVLVAHARREAAITIEMGRHVSGLTPVDADAAQSAGAALTSDEGETFAGAVLVGADGLWSALRGAIVQDCDLPYSGMTAARSLVDPSVLPESLRANATHVWLAPSAHVVMYPVDGGRQVALVVITTRPQPSQGWGVAVDRQAFLAGFSELNADLLEVLQATQDWRQWALFDPPPLTTWSRGPAMLIGDAAHPMLPFMAQGGAMAIEDAFVLGRLIARHGPVPAHVFPAFESLRLQRAGQIQRASRENGRIYHLGGIAARGRDMAMRTAPPQFLMMRYDWIYAWRYDEDHGEVAL